MSLVRSTLCIRNYGSPNHPTDPLDSKVRWIAFLVGLGPLVHIEQAKIRFPVAGDGRWMASLEERKINDASYEFELNLTKERVSTSLKDDKD